MTPFELGPGESKTLDVVFVALSKPGVFTSSIIIGDEVIPVTITVRQELLLFDTKIQVLNKDKKIEEGGILKTKITLIPMGDKQRFDVTLNYEIKDFSNKVYLKKSETLLVTEKKEIERSFNIKSLPLGKYVIALEAVYPRGIAPSSDQFEVVGKAPMSLLLKIIIVILIWMIVILIVAIIIILYRRKQKEKEAALSNLGTPSYRPTSSS